MSSWEDDMKNRFQHSDHHSYTKNTSTKFDEKIWNSYEVFVTAYETEV